MGVTAQGNLRFDVPDDGSDDNTWGAILNTLISEMELAITGIAAFTLNASDVTLDVSGGTADRARRAVIMATGALSGNVDFIVPAEPKIYIVSNKTTEAFTVGIKVTGQTRLNIPQDSRLLVFTDGTDFFEINALTSGTVANATDSTKLIGVAGADFAQKGVKNQWTKPQVIDATRAVLTLANPKTFAPNVDNETNILITQAEMDRDGNDVSILSPTGTPVDAQIMVITVEQGVSAVKSIIWASDFKWPDDTAVDLTQTVNKIDAFSFMYNSNVSFWLNFGTSLNIPRS